MCIRYQKIEVKRAVEHGYNCCQKLAIQPAEQNTNEIYW